jgi:amino acid transporter
VAAPWGPGAQRATAKYDFMGVGLAVGGQTLRHLFFAAMLAGNFALFIAFLAAGARPSYVLSKDKLMPKFLGKESKSGTPYLAILLMAGVDAILVRWGFKTLIVIDVFLLMLAHITIYISALRLRIKQPDLPRPFKVKLGTKAFAAMCVVPVAVAVLAMSPFGNGWNYFVWGSVVALTGPPAYLIFKKIYGGRDLPEVGFEYADDDGSGAAVAAALATSGDESVAAPSVTGR